MSTNMMESPASPIRLSIIVPVHNNPGDLAACLAALWAAAPPASEIIVVDDASTDATPAVAAVGGARVLRLAQNSGPAAARNHGAEHARGDLLLFVDADVVVAPGAIRRIGETFAEDPQLAAVFGSYDSRPHAPGLVSRYRNLLHHFVHQEGRVAAATFWAGLGAVRRAVFLEIGGFDAARFRRPSIEDIELGYRLRRAGYTIRLDKGLQGTHLKQWRLWAMIRTDVTCRALPWARLILETGNAPADLNLSPSQRVSAALASLALLAAAAAPLRVGFLAASGLALLGVAAINRRLYVLLLRQGGPRLAAVGFVLHVLYFIYGAATYLYAWLEWRLRSMAAALARLARVVRV